jgi:hypothetical protein
MKGIIFLKLKILKIKIILRKLGLISGILALIFVFLFCDYTKCENKCPTPEEIEPCICKEAKLLCKEKTVSSHELKLVGQQILENNYQFDSITISNTSVIRIDKNTFPSGNFQVIQLDHNENLEFIDPQAFSGSVKSFLFENNPKMNESIFNVIKNLNITEKMVINFNNLNEIPMNALNSSAKEINMENNRIKKILSNAFSSLPNLEILSLKNNSIESIDDFGLNLKSNEFHKTIYLNHNKLNVASFKEKSLPKLKDDSVFIHLEDNLIHSLTDNIFKPFLVEEKHKIFFERNQFECDCSMRWIAEEPQSNHIYGVFCADKQKSIFDATPKELGCKETTTEPTTPPTTQPATSPTTKPATSPTTKPATSPTTKPATFPTTKLATSPTTKPTTSPTTKPKNTDSITTSTTKETTIEP